MFNTKLTTKRKKREAFYAEIGYRGQKADRRKAAHPTQTKYGENFDRAIDRKRGKTKSKSCHRSK